MGKERSYEIIDIRKSIMRKITSSPELVKLLGFENEEYPEDVIPYNKSFPHEYVPDTIKTTDKFINFDIRATAFNKNDVYKNITVYFYIMCHQDVVRYEDKRRKYLWYDKVTCELDRIFSTQDSFGVGKMTLTENVPYSPQNKFKGRVLIFKTLDYMDGKKYGR